MTTARLFALMLVMMTMFAPAASAAGIDLLPNGIHLKIGGISVNADVSPKAVDTSALPEAPAIPPVGPLTGPIAPITQPIAQRVAPLAQATQGADGANGGTAPVSAAPKSAPSMLAAALIPFAIAGALVAFALIWAAVAWVFGRARRPRTAHTV